MKSWLCASTLAACLTSAGAPTQAPAQGSAPARRVNELSLAGLGPGKDTLAAAERRYKPKYRLASVTNDSVKEWADTCRGRSLRLELDAKGFIRSVTISALARRDANCVEKRGDFLGQSSWATGRGLKLGEPRDRVIDYYGEPASGGPSVKGGRELELLSYAFDWAGSDVPQVLEVSCDRATGRVVEITLAYPSL